MPENIKRATITIQFYCGDKKFNWQILKKKYIVQQWTDEGHLREILNEIAYEIHYLSGYGIELIKAEMPSKKFVVPYPQYQPYNPEKNSVFFYALRFDVGYSICGERVWLDIPRIDPLQEYPDQLFPVYTKASYNKKERRQTKTKFDITYNKEDPHLVSFFHKLSKPATLVLYGKRSPYTIRETVTCISWWFLPKTQTSQYKGEQNRKKMEKEERKRRQLEQSGIVYKEKKKTEKADQVYIIQMDESEVAHVYKIGVSNAPGRRLRALQTSSPFPLKIVHRFVADRAEDAEATLHARYKEHQLQGEWFRLTPKQLSELQHISAYKNGKFLKSERSIQDIN